MVERRMRSFEEKRDNFVIYFSLGRRMRGNIDDSVDETGGECAWANGSIWREERVAEVTLYVNRMDWFRFSNSRRYFLKK